MTGVQTCALPIFELLGCVSAYAYARIYANLENAYIRAYIRSLFLYTHYVSPNFEVSRKVVQMSSTLKAQVRSTKKEGINRMRIQKQAAYIRAYIRIFKVCVYTRVCVCANAAQKFEGCSESSQHHFRFFCHFERRRCREPFCKNTLIRMCSRLSSEYFSNKFENFTNFSDRYL